FGSVRAFPPEPVELVRKLVVALSSGTSLDLVALARAAGFTVDMPQDEGQAFLARLAELSTRPLQVDHYDFAQDQMAKDTRDFMARNVGRALKVRPPADSIFFFRALGGLGQNLKPVGASGSFQSMVRELLALPELSPSSSRTSEPAIWPLTPRPGDRTPCRPAGSAANVPAISGAAMRSVFRALITATLLAGCPGKPPSDDENPQPDAGTPDAGNTADGGSDAGDSDDEEPLP